MSTLLIADHAISLYSDDQLSKWFMLLRQWKINVELEVGVIKEWGPTSSKTFHAEYPIWDRVLRLNGPLTAIAMDEPYAAAKNLKLSPEYAFNEVRNFATLTRERYGKRLIIGDIEPYPSFTASTLEDWQDKLSSITNADGSKLISFFRIDPDWTAFRNDIEGWKQLIPLQFQTQHSGMFFSLIYWASPYPAALARGEATDQLWYTDVMAQASAVTRSGLQIDESVHQIWVKGPIRIIPDTDRYTFMGTAISTASHSTNNYISSP